MKQSLSLIAALISVCAFGIARAEAPGIGASYDENNYGCYFRLTGAEGGRVGGVRFERPPVP